jgi:hypothetical protein
MSTTTGTITTIVAVLGGTAAMIAVVSFWAAHAIDALSKTIGDKVEKIDTRLERIEYDLIREHGERITRLEERL